MFLFALIPAAIALISTVLGRAARGERHRWLNRRLVVPAGLMIVATAILAITAIDPEVGTRDAVVGVLIAAIFLGLVPVTVYYTLGYFVRPWWLLLVIGVPLAVGTFFYLFFGLLIVFEYVYCPPDAYECPL